MLALGLRWIMLVAFTAHAVLGCCIHHHHAASELLNLLASVETNAADALAGRATHALTSCCHHHSATQVVEPARGATTAVPPTHDGHECDESNCLFLAADYSPASECVDVGVGSVGLYLLQWDSAGPQSLTVALAAASPALNPTLGISAQACCAAHGSWQL